MSTTFFHKTDLFPRVDILPFSLYTKRNTPGILLRKKAQVPAMKDMTTGSAAKHIFLYALPLMLSNWFQMGYNAIDSIIAGRFIGKEALAAVGIASPVMNLVILSVSGLCLGAGILMSEFFGAKDFKTLRRQFSTALLSGLVLSLLVAILGITFTYPVMKALAVPAEIAGTTAIYLRITFLGAPFTFLYNAAAAALKGIGDSKTPLKFLMFSSLLNAVLDILFIGILGFGIVCSATTTVMAEAVSAFLVLFYIPLLRFSCLLICLRCICNCFLKHFYHGCFKKEFFFNQKVFTLQCCVGFCHTST